MASEETFSFRVRELAPAALRVLDMQDMEALRRGVLPRCRNLCDLQPCCAAVRRSLRHDAQPGRAWEYSSPTQCGECSYPGHATVILECEHGVCC